MTTGWPGLTFQVMAFAMSAVWCAVARPIFGSVKSGWKWLLVSDIVSDVLEKYAGKLIWYLMSSGSVANFNSQSLGCADADPSRKNESGSMSEETGNLGFLETVGWISLYDTGSLHCFLLPEFFASTLHCFLGWQNFCVPSRRFCFTLLRLISWERFTETFWISADNSCEGFPPSRILLIILTKELRAERYWRFFWNITIKNLITDKQIFLHYFSSFVEHSLILFIWPYTCLKLSSSNFIVYCKGDLSPTFSHT